MMHFLLMVGPLILNNIAFGILWLKALDAQHRAEVERDQLWDQRHAIYQTEQVISRHDVEDIVRAIKLRNRKRGVASAGL
jgi:hypothetical protein